MTCVTFTAVTRCERCKAQCRRSNPPQSLSTWEDVTLRDAAATAMRLRRVTGLGLVLSRFVPLSIEIEKLP
jgi:hypothetical protein